jgi:hypothetical protein
MDGLFFAAGVFIGAGFASLLVVLIDIVLNRD